MEDGLRVFENRVQRDRVGPYREVVTGAYRRLHSRHLTKHYSEYHSKKEIGGACGTHDEGGENANKVLCEISGIRRGVINICAFCTVTQRRLVVCYRRFGTTYRSHLKSPRINLPNILLGLLYH
jgi:hypothetical protein